MEEGSMHLHLPVYSIVQKAVPLITGRRHTWGHFSKQADNLAIVSQWGQGQCSHASSPSLCSEAVGKRVVVGTVLQRILNPDHYECFGPWSEQLHRISQSTLSWLHASISCTEPISCPLRNENSPVKLSKDIFVLLCVQCSLLKLLVLFSVSSCIIFFIF